MMDTVAKGRKRIGTIRWAVVLAVVIAISAVVSYLLTSAVRYFYYGTENDNYWVWSAVIYQIMGSFSGVMVAAVSIMLYRRMEKLLNGIEEVAKGNLEAEISLENAGEYRVIYENFNQMVRKLKSADEQQKQFMKDFSHEFKTPINSMKGFAEYLYANELPREEEKQYLKIMTKEAGRLAQLSQNTLLLSKLERMETIQNKERYRLDMQIRDCAILMLPSFEEKKIKLGVELSEIWYTGNEEILEEIWINLLDNAKKYSPEGTSVFVEGKVTEEYIRIEVRDEGQGMDEDTKLHLFDRYYQGDTSHESAGFGLGLSIVKRIVDLCKGSIRVESTLRKGTSIFIYL